MSRRTEPSGAFSNAALCAAPAGSTTGVSSTADAGYRMPDAECPAVLEAARGSAAAAASLESASLRGVDSSSGSSPRRPAEVSASVNRDSL